MNETKRTKRLQNLIDLIEAGNDVANRDLKNVLSPDEWQTYSTSVEEQRNFKTMFADVPSELAAYISLLKRADLLHSRAESMHAQGKAKTSTTLLLQSEAAYGNALEHLADATEREPDLHLWLDRPFRQKPDDSYSLEPSGVPRLITSTSFNRQQGLESMTNRRRQLKLDALQDSLMKLNAGTATPDNEQAGYKLPSAKTKLPTDTSDFDFS